MGKITFNTLAVILFYTVLPACKEHQIETKSVTEISPTDSLPSWNDGPNKKAILDFVATTTTPGNPGFIPIEDRIACFDNDGTLWSEQPVYFQLQFGIDQVKSLAPQHPEWQKKEPFASIIKGDLKGLMASGEKGLAAVIMTSHAGMTAENFDKSVKDWMSTATHPKTGKHYNEMTYKPMVELLNYLRAHDYKTFIVSGGGVDFMRAWTEAAYGIPPYQVVGSSIKSKYVVENGQPSIVKMPELNFYDDKEAKPVAIHQYIGKRPVFTGGNSDGDFAMLQYTSTGTGYPRFGLIIHHTDSTREVAYDRNSHIGQLNKGLDSAAKYNWTIIDMQKDWNKVFTFE